MKNLIFFASIIYLMSGCEKSNIIVSETHNFKSLIVNDTIELAYHDCIYDAENHSYLCLDSVLNDSRCPRGAECFWAGNAEVRFKYERYNAKSILFNLNTTLQPTAYTIADGYKFTLIDLSPYPSLGHRIAQKDYKAHLLVEKNK